MTTDDLVVNGLIKVTSQAEVDTLTVDQVNDVSAEEISQLSGTTDNVQEQINALATSYDESIDASTEFKNGVANAVNNLSDESNLTAASTLAEVLDTIGTVETKNYQKRRLLNSSDNLNNVTKNGFYDILGTSQPTNIPSGTSSANAMLEVFDLPDMNITCQIYHKFDLIFGMDTYIRRCESGTWTSWIHKYGTGTATTPGVTKLYTSTGSNTDGTMTQKAILSALNLKSDCKVLTSEDLNSIVSPGFYNAGGGNTISNKPSGVDHFGLIVIHRASGKYYTQIIFNDTSSYRRFCVNGTWGSWAQDELTDTTYGAATQSANGLMISSDKKKLDFTNVAYGTCSTDAATAAKVVTISGNTSWVLQKGAILICKFTVTNTASNVTLNVNNTGAKSIWYNTAVYTGSSSAICGYANKTYVYTYDGTYWVWLSGGVDYDTDTKATQTNTTTSADYRLALSYNANDTTETQTLRKSGNFLANPSTGELYAKGYRRISITGQTLDVNTLNLSDGAPQIMRYIEKTDGGAGNITNIPVAGKPFLLDVELIRWSSTTDYITRQTFRNASNPANEYVRFCNNGTWSSWVTRVFTDTKNTAGSTDTSSKIFLVGATSQAASPQTYSDNQVYATNGQLDANKFRVGEKVTMQYNSSTESLDFVFA